MQGLISRLRSIADCGPTAVAGPGFGGQKEGWAGEDQEGEEEVQAENPGEYSETEARSAEKNTDQKKTKEKGRGNSVKTAHMRVYTATFITVQ